MVVLDFSLIKVSIVLYYSLLTILFLWRILVQSVVTLTIKYISFLSALEWTLSLLLSLLWTRNKISFFLVLIPSSNILYNSISSLLAFSHLFSFQKLWSTCEIVLEITSLLSLLIFLSFHQYSKSPILLLPSLFSFFFIFFSFLFFFFSSFFSFAFFSFYLCHPDFSCFCLHCFPHFSEYLVIFTSPVF